MISINKEILSSKLEYRLVSVTYPAFPVDSILLAIVTSLDQISNCHFLIPIRPLSIFPECTPILISMFRERFSLQTIHVYSYKSSSLKNNCNMIVSVGVTDILSCEFVYSEFPARVHVYFYIISLHSIIVWLF